MDELDINIIKELQLDGRISISELSKKVALSRPSVKERIQRLQDKGIIDGYSAIVPPSTVGRKLLVMIEISDLRSSPQEFEQMIIKQSDVIECHKATGHVNYYVKAALNGTEDLTQLIENLFLFGSTKTSILLETTLDRRVILPHINDKL